MFERCADCQAILCNARQLRMHRLKFHRQAELDSGSAGLPFVSHNVSAEVCAPDIISANDNIAQSDVLCSVGALPGVTEEREVIRHVVIDSSDDDEDEYDDDNLAAADDCVSDISSVRRALVRCDMDISQSVAPPCLPEAHDGCIETIGDACEKFSDVLLNMSETIQPEPHQQLCDKFEDRLPKLGESGTSNASDCSLTVQKITRSLSPEGKRNYQEPPNLQYCTEEPSTSVAHPTFPPEASSDEERCYSHSKCSSSSTSCTSDDEEYVPNTRSRKKCYPKRRRLQTENSEYQKIFDPSDIGPVQLSNVFRPPRKVEGTSIHSECHINLFDHRDIGPVQLSDDARPPREVKVGPPNSKCQKMLFDPSDIGLVQLSDDVHPPRKVKREPLPAKGSKAYKEIRNEDAKNRRIASAGKYKCPHCDYTNPFPSKVKNHLQINHSRGRFKCSICSSTFDSQSDQRKHLSLEHPIVHKCNDCGYSHNRLGQVRQHIRNVHINSIPCTFPGCLVKVSIRKLRSHVNAVHSNELFFAPKSERHFDKLDNRPAHECPKCNFVSETMEERDMHLENIHVGILCPVEYCDERLPLSDFDMHMATMHPDEMMELPLEKCITSERGGVRKGGASLMTRSETGESVDDLATTVTSLRDDQILSSDEESVHDGDDFRCTTEVKHKGGLARKNGIGGFDCATCGSSFKTLLTMKNHVKKVHERVYKDFKRSKNFVCDWPNCGKRYAANVTLMDHYTSHTGEFPYRCKSCRTSYRTRAGYGMHLKSLHGSSIKDFAALDELLPQLRRDRSAKAETKNE